MELYNNDFDKFSVGTKEVQAHYFLTSAEDYTVVNSLTTSSDCKMPCRCKGVEHDHKELNKPWDLWEFWFVESGKEAGNEITMLVKKRTRNNSTLELVKGTRANFLENPDGEYLDDFLTYCQSCWCLIRVTKSKLKCYYTRPARCLWGTCKHVIMAYF